MTDFLTFFAFDPFCWAFNYVQVHIFHISRLSLAVTFVLRLFEALVFDIVCALDLTWFLPLQWL